MKKISFLLVTTIFLIGNISCQKFLEKKSNSTLVVPSTLKDLQGILDDGTSMNLKRTPCYLETSADDYFLTPAYFESAGRFTQSFYTWQAISYDFSNDWSIAYAPVFSANLCLDLLKKIDRTPANDQAWDNVKGSALFFRSYYFLWLAWNYAKAYDETTSEKDLGIVLRMSSDFNVPSVRANVKQTYSAIISDLKESIPLLPKYPQHVYRPSQTAAYALLARTYFSMRDYNNALLYADSCLQLKSDLMDYNGDPDISDLSKNAPFRQFNKETIFYTEMAATLTTLHLPSTACIDTTLYNSYEDIDLRKIAFFRPSRGYHTFKGSYTGNANVYFSGLATNEMYLVRAECHARTGNTKPALGDLNRLLSKRYVAGSFSQINDYSTDEVLEIILKEQRKELIMRGLRWMNIKRLNQGGANISLSRLANGDTVTLSPNSPFFALPLPDDIIRTTGIQQN